MADAGKIKQQLIAMLQRFPWRIDVSDWSGNHYRLGGNEPHWFGRPLRVHFHQPAPAQALTRYDGQGFLEGFLSGQVDLLDNLFLLTAVRDHLFMQLTPWQTLRHLLFHQWFQTPRRSKINVKTHYDIPQELLDGYLDQIYMAYSCAIFDDPWNMDHREMLKPGTGREDDWDSLEKAQWRKFKNAVDFIKPAPGDTLLDIGCGYGGQLLVALEHQPFGKVTGWTHSNNQVQRGQEMLTTFPREKWEMCEGDYREETRLFDHVTSTGMISHVGPRGLIPYVRWVHKHINPRGRYVHHAIMHHSQHGSQERAIGVAFNHDYVWPGFHWFSLGEHVRALEDNGFIIDKVVDLSPHYAKTTFAWYLRMMHHRPQFVARMGEPTFRAWQVYLAGGAESFRNFRNGVGRIYCTRRDHYFDPARDQNPVSGRGELFTGKSGL